MLSNGIRAPHFEVLGMTRTARKRRRQLAKGLRKRVRQNPRHIATQAERRVELQPPRSLTPWRFVVRYELKTDGDPAIGSRLIALRRTCAWHPGPSHEKVLTPALAIGRFEAGIIRGSTTRLAIRTRFVGPHMERREGGPSVVRRLTSKRSAQRKSSKQRLDHGYVVTLGPKGESQVPIGDFVIAIRRHTKRPEQHDSRRPSA